MDRVIGAGRDNDRRQEERICDMKKMGKSKREGERECVCWVTHWVSSRSEGD